MLDNKTLRAETTLNFMLNKPTGYHFVLTDCKKNLVNEYFNKKSKLYYEVNIMTNGENIADDERKLKWLIPLFLVSTVVSILALQNKSSFGEHN